MLTVILLLLGLGMLMTLVVPDQGEQIMLDAATGKAAATAWDLRLFKNNHTPVHTDTEADYTEAAGGGYASIALNPANWSTVPGSPTVSQQPTQVFTFAGPLTAGATVYGYYVTDAGGLLVYAELLTAPFTPANAGDTISITPLLTFASVSGD